jgi:hypothetical protein
MKSIRKKEEEQERAVNGTMISISGKRWAEKRQVTGSSWTEEYKVFVGEGHNMAGVVWV